MDPTVSNEALALPDRQSDGADASVSEKRLMENGESEELAVRSAKRLKSGARGMRRVAEIVLVLSAMAGMRGGKSPREAEVKLMEEAREKLVEICRDLSPRDLVARDAIGTVIEDLGLNWKAKDQRLGFRGSRLSIKEKVLLSKRKMEDAKKFAVPSVAYTSPASQPSFGAAPENRGQLHTTRMLPTDKPSNHAPLPSGGLPASSPLGHVSPATPTPLTQPVTTEVRASSASAGLPSGHLGRDSSTLTFPRVEKTQGVSNGTTYAPQVPANASANHPLVNAPTWSIQPHSTSSGKSAPENKALNHIAKVEGTVEMGMPQTSSQAARDQAFRPFVTQTSSASLPSVHPPMQGMKYVQPSSFFNNHNEIAKLVQKLLQPKLPEHPTWTPPSREYMNKALTCQMCKLTVNEVETVVLCDACEKGFHLKCLEALNQKGIPRGEWHCLKCTALSNGKPLPPKYGRVMRSITPLKGPSNPAGAQSPSEKKLGTLDPKVNQEKITANGNSSLQNPAGSGTVGSNVESASDSKIPNEREMQGNGTKSSGKNVGHWTCAGTFPNNSIERSTQPTPVSKSPMQETGLVSESKLQPSAMLSGKSDDKCEDSKLSHKLQDIVPTESSNSAEVPLKTCQDHPFVEEPDSAKGNSDYASRFDVKQSEQDVEHANPAGSSEPDNWTRERAGLSSGGFHGVEWIGNVVKVVDEKSFYKSCCIDGITYKVQDHALFCSTHDKLIPSKLQAMWEDIKTGSKWVLVNRCYFPGDLPEAVGHPCAPEINEVYESNHESSIMAGLIQGPCEVLPPSKFKEKSERQSQSGTEANGGSKPFFLCKWFYDQFKGNFQPVFS